MIALVYVLVGLLVASVIALMFHDDWKRNPREAGVWTALAGLLWPGTVFAAVVVGLTFALAAASDAIAAWIKEGER